MPLTESGRKALASMMSQYGAEKGKEIFYSSINSGKAGSEKWHEGKSKKHAKKKGR